MATNNDPEATAVIDSLSRMIHRQLRIAAAEQEAPMGDADRSYQEIRDALRRAREYARIRDEIEELVTGAIRR